ncbi:hypothetical protein ACGFYV_26155 [Streptomyces sp. NPDC048297]|uniref:hypothetical protein n=1 Tax=Streptomyces sp. NPDC048297 TaxID=3365531 RepID=UPI003720BCF2
MTPTTKSKNNLLRSRNRLIGSVLTASTVLALAACSSEPSKNDARDTAPPVSSTDKPSASPSQDPTAPVKDAYQHYWEEQVKAYSKGDAKGTDLSLYSGALALSKTEDDLKDFKAKGIVTTGAPGHDVHVTSFQPDAKVPQAKITDCLDTSTWKFIYRDTRKPVEMPKDRLVRYLTTVDAEKWGNQWKVLNVVQQQRAC